MLTSLYSRLLKEVKLSLKDIGKPEFLRDFKSKTSAVGVPTLSSKLGCSEGDVQLIVEALSQSPHEDPLRNNKPIYSVAINNIGQLKEGSKLTGNFVSCLSLIENLYLFFIMYHDRKAIHTV